MQDQSNNINFLDYIDLRTFCSNGFSFEMNEIELSLREIQCLAGWMLGLTAKQIAILLCLSHRTIENHLEKIKIKLKCANRSEIILLAFMHNFPIHLCFKTDKVQNE